MMMTLLTPHLLEFLRQHDSPTSEESDLGLVILGHLLQDLVKNTFSRFSGDQQEIIKRSSRDQQEINKRSSRDHQEIIMKTS